MPKYRKKPVVVDAFHYVDSESLGPARPVPSWLVEAIYDKKIVITSSDTGTAVKVSTEEGDMTVSPGDYIIKGTQGELYPCKPDIFEEIYERIT